MQRSREQNIAVAVFRTSEVIGECVAIPANTSGVRLSVRFEKLPDGKHGFHIHEAGDLRGEGCKGACSHFHVGHPASHGGPPGKRPRGERHTGDLGNIEGNGFAKTYFLANVGVSDLWGRSLIVHADEDDLGEGFHEDSATTGHSGARIACAIFGRGMNTCAHKTRKHRRKSSRIIEKR